MGSFLPSSAPEPSMTSISFASDRHTHPCERAHTPANTIHAIKGCQKATAVMRVCFQPKSVDVQQIKDPINNRRDHTVSEIHGNQRSSEKEDKKGHRK